jgi:hypothetical protein
LIAGSDVRVREVDREQCVVVADRGAQQQRPGVAEAQLEPREKPGPLVINALFPEADGAAVAVAVEDGERLAVLEDAHAVLGGGGGRQNVVLVFDLDNVVGARVRPRRPDFLTGSGHKFSNSL